MNAIRRFDNFKNRLERASTELSEKQQAEVMQRLSACVNDFFTHHIMNSLEVEPECDCQDCPGR